MLPPGDRRPELYRQLLLADGVRSRGIYFLALLLLVA
jgi:hypothetical protein